MPRDVLNRLGVVLDKQEKTFHCHKMLCIIV